MQSEIPKLWGKEVVLHNEGYCSKLLIYSGPHMSSEHYHEKKHETFVIVRGTCGILWYDIDAPDAARIRPLTLGGCRKFGPGSALVLPPRTVHRVECLSKEGGMLAEAASHDDPNDCVRLAPSVAPG